jgi:hypothetical protein
MVSRSKSSASSKRNASSIESGQNSGYSSYGGRPKCKLRKSFPSIGPTGCKVKDRQEATSSRRSGSHSSRSGSHSSRSSSHNNGSGPGPGHSNGFTLTHVSDSVAHSSQATRSSRGSRGSQAISESIIERRFPARLRRYNDNLNNYYAKKKKQGKASSRYVPGTSAGASYPQSSQRSRA